MRHRLLNIDMIWHRGTALFVFFFNLTVTDNFRCLWWNAKYNTEKKKTEDSEELETISFLKIPTAPV